MNLYSAEQCRKLDQIAIQQQKIPGLLLMKKAAWKAFQVMQTEWPDAKHICVVCGSGNNGGDGLMLAQYAALQNLKVEILIADDIDTFHNKLKGDALTVFEEAKQLKLSMQTFSAETLQQSDLIVDALFGTGLDRDIKGTYQNIIETINHHPAPTLALDVPSGIDGSTGKILNCAIEAQQTVTFIGHKSGLWMHEGAEMAGDITLATLDLNFGKELPFQPLAQMHSAEHWHQHLSQRPKTFHKGQAGTTLLIGGNHSMMGAIQLAGQAALKTGSGLIKIATRPEHTAAITAQTPELMCSTSQNLPGLLEKVDAVAIGPGLGQDDWARELFQQTLNQQLQHQTPMVLDADALKQLAEQTAVTPSNPNWVLTPHPGEAAQMLNCSTQQVQQDRFAAIQSLHKKYGGVIILKGNGSLIFDGQSMELCPLGNPGMATGGMGDVLTGMITSYLAQGLNGFEAACLAVYQHADAADQYCALYSEYSLTPSDLIQFL